MPDQRNNTTNNSKDSQEAKGVTKRPMQLMLLGAVDKWNLHYHMFQQEWYQARSTKKKKKKKVAELRLR